MLLSTLLHLGLPVYARRFGARVDFDDERLRITRGERSLILSARHLMYSRDAIRNFDQYWGSVRDRDGVVDYSTPSIHVYRDSGLSFWLPGIPEEPDGLRSYFYWDSPRPGDLVFDLGAHSGVTSYHLARMVGPRGTVIAFEPDPTAFEMLCRNIELHGLPNVVPVRRAVAGTSGPRAFNCEGSLGAAFATLVNRRGLAPVTTVECVSLADSCAEFGVPRFVKMDIEGAEIEVVAAAGDLFHEHDIRVAADSFHPVDGQPSASRLEALFRSYGYKAASGTPYGYLTTWAHRQTDTTAD